MNARPSVLALLGTGAMVAGAICFLGADFNRWTADYGIALIRAGAAA